MVISTRRLVRPVRVVVAGATSRRSGSTPAAMAVQLARVPAARAAWAGRLVAVAAIDQRGEPPRDRSPADPVRAGEEERSRTRAGGPDLAQFAHHRFMTADAEVETQRPTSNRAASTSGYPAARTS